MKTVRLGFKAFDPHELLCHFLAVRGGYYRDADLQVELIDITFTPDEELPPQMFQASCGAAMLAGLRSVPQRIVFVGVDRPMFWLYAQQGIDKIDALRQGKLATFPSIAPPWHFTRLLMKQHGLDPDKDVILVPARDDAARLGLLRSGNADAAVLSSAMPPARIEGLGLHRIGCLGDAVRMPTTGLATHANTIEGEPALVGAMVSCHLQGLRHIHEDTEAVRQVLEGTFDIESAFAHATAELYGTCFTRNGTMDAVDVSAAIEMMAQILQLSDTPARQDVYDSSFV